MPRPSRCDAATSERGGERGVAGEPLGRAVVVAHRAGDLAEVADAVRCDEDVGVRRRLDAGVGEDARRRGQPVRAERTAHLVVQGGDAVVVEPRRDRPEDRELVQPLSGRAAEPGDLATDLAEGVVRRRGARTC